VDTKAGGCKPFELAFMSNMTWSQFKYYSDILLSNSLLILSKTEPVKRFEISEKGLRYLQLLADLEDDLGPV
jgi:predicted transcriptional regulator